jgi:hypothetical protein
MKNTAWMIPEEKPQDLLWGSWGVGREGDQQYEIWVFFAEVQKKAMLLVNEMVEIKCGHSSITYVDVLLLAHTVTLYPIDILAHTA